MKYFSFPLFFLLLTVLSFNACKKSSVPQYITNGGEIFGTYYKFIYDNDSDLHPILKAMLDSIDMSLNPFNPKSVISRINNNEDPVTDKHFETVFKEAGEVIALSKGAFDITVAPLVNLWGFGFENKDVVTQKKIDSLLTLVNFLGLTLNDHHIYKSDNRIKMDCGAIGKGYACDVIAELLEQHNCKNYIVEIGGELIVKGHKPDGSKWRLGLTKPIDDITGTVFEIQDTIYATEGKFATSGNYRNYYYEGTQRRSHTIDPRTGYPVQHKLLSATVFAKSGTRADALATCCMVLGEKDALELIENTPDAGCYFILDGKDNVYQIIKSSRWKEKYDDKTK